MKKFAIGCGAVIGLFLVISIIIAVISSLAPDQVEPKEGERPPAPVEVEPKESKSPPAPIKVELAEAQSKGLIEYIAYGQDNLERFKLSLTSKSDDTLEISILPGTVFEPQSASVQSMVVIAEKVLLLHPHKTAGPVNIDAAGATMRLDIPSASDRLVVKMTPAAGDLMKLLNLSDFHNETFQTQQFAIWTITDNPRRDEYTSIIGTRPSSLGTGLGEEEVEKIRLLFEMAEISTDNYRALQKPVFAELIEAETKGLIEVSAYGTNNLERIKLSLTSKSDDTLEISILPGTIFEPQSASVQSMVVIAEKVLLLHPHETVGPVNIDAACANMQLDMPGKSDSLSLRMSSDAEDLIKLLNLADFHEETFQVKQFAIWTITDNPRRGEYVGIGYFGAGTGPSDEEMERIRVLFEKAGISTNKYRALS